MARAKKLSREEAEEYTKNLGQVAVGNFGLMEFAMHTLRVPESLGMTKEEWVQDRLGGYIRWSVGQRREAVRELSGEQSDGGRWARSAKQVAEILGISVATVTGDREFLEAQQRPKALKVGAKEAQQRPLTPAQRKAKVKHLVAEGKSNAEIAVELDSTVSAIRSDRSRIKKEEAPGPSEKLKEAKQRKQEELDKVSPSEKKESEAKLEEFRSGMMEKFATIRSPIGYIESAIEEVRWFVSEDVEMENEDEIIRRYIELGRELQVYGARRNINTQALDEALAAITKE